MQSIRLVEFFFQQYPANIPSVQKISLQIKSTCGKKSKNKKVGLSFFGTFKTNNVLCLVQKCLAKPCTFLCMYIYHTLNYQYMYGMWVLHTLISKCVAGWDVMMVNNGLLYLFPLKINK